MMLARLRNFWRVVTRRNGWEAELRDELRGHLEDRAADLVARGVPEGQARRRARIELGSAEQYREEARAASGLRWLDEIRQDLRYAARAVARSPSFAAVAVTSLALGVGANTVVFSVLDSLVLRPLPIARPAEVYFVQPNFWPSFSYPNYRDVRDRVTRFSGMAAYALAPVAISADQRAERVWAFLVTGSYFELLGLRPALGRLITPAEDRDPGGHPVAVLSHATWRRRFGGDSAVVGRTIPVNGRGYTVVGVAPPGFFGTEVVLRPEIFLPMAMQAEVTGRSWLESRDTWNLFALGRLAPGATPREATAELASIAAALGREFPDQNQGLEIRIGPPGLFGDKARGPVTAFSVAVQALAVLVLLAACANLASLFAARVSDRARELAVRMSIGAGRSRVIRQLVTETVALSLLGGAAGWLLAWWILDRLSGWRPPGTGALLQVDVTPSWRVFSVALAAAVVAGLVSAIAPARAAWRVDLAAIIKGVPSRAGGRRRSGFRDGLLFTQVTVAAILVAGCLVAVRGLQRSLAMSTGIRPAGVAVVGFDPTLIPRPAAEARVLQRRIRDAAAALPGVSATGFGSAVPLSLYQSHVSAYRFDEVDFKGQAAVTVTEYSASPGFLEVLGTRLVAGRDFAWTDDDDAPRVAIVNRRLAELVLRPGDPIGQRFKLDATIEVEVIGMVEDGRYETLAESRRAVAFWSALQQRPGQTMLLARSLRPAQELAAEMRAAVTALDGSLPLTDVGPLENLTDYALMPARIAAIALSGFGLLALMLAITGIHGMAAYTVSRRTREIGVRMALGAVPGTIVRQILGRIGALVAAGSAIGIVIALVSARLVGNVVFQASPREPLVLIGTAGAMVVVALLAAAAPARRAATIQPQRSLRS